ncbi:helix-turn-helix domain-containing protein [Exilibacterium tricleocarpae]|uniref:Helix-turn-helix domain-containing protein n=1 Tax=Exilibacterium tricleocarpae TaxID=2591008 RepID=A0A545TVI0_9GAMM|nr:helix-turn-helix domain-containing protein [Exilibacterium tricleocarpae]TQV81212.1 helix-turn-helix domain-containing protein [Exilibacterium tricleocarpae]
MKEQSSGRAGVETTALMGRRRLIHRIAAFSFLLITAVQGRSIEAAVAENRSADKTYAAEVLYVVVGVTLTITALWLAWRWWQRRRGPSPRQLQQKSQRQPQEKSQKHSPRQETTSDTGRRRKGSGKYATSAFKPEQQQRYADLLFTLMQEQKPYLDTGLRLKDLAGMLSLSSHQLSELLNQTLGKPYYEFINEYRVAEAKAIMRRPESAAMNMLAVAHAAGFGNKASFNRIFKEITGMTPSAYRKKISPLIHA